MIPRERVRALLADFADVPAADDAPLTLDSLALVQLVEALEDEGGIRISAKEVTRENFGSVGAIVAFLETKR
jgi:acyl carrier protein